MRLGRCVAILVACAGTLIVPATAGAATPSMPVMPQWMAAKLAGADGENCVGINTSELWRDYDGPCKFGGYVPPMQGGSSTYSRKKLDTKMTEIGMPLGLRVLTLNEMDRFAASNREQAKKRIRRDARRGKRSTVAGRAVLCAAVGAVAAGANFISEAVTKQKIEDVRSVAKDFMAGCIAGLATPRVIGWVKKKGFQIDA